MNLPDDIGAMLDAAADKHGVPRPIARAVAWVESRGEQSSISTAGAIGVMQLMPDTATGLGVDPYDAPQNIEGGVRFLAALIKTFGSERDAFAAYNWGPSRVAKASVWPAQVRTYVDRVEARAIVEHDLMGGAGTRRDPFDPSATLVEQFSQASPSLPSPSEPFWPDGGEDDS